MRLIRTILAVSSLIALTFPPLGQGQPAASPVYAGTDAYRLAPRNALVIGVSSVAPLAGFLPLGNPVNDAAAVTQALRDLNFNVIAPNEGHLPQQMTRQVIKKALYDFAFTLRSLGGVGLIYYSGHGIQRDGQMYLVPYDTYVKYDRDLDEEMIPLRFFYEAFKYAGNNLNILVVDACRNNPWQTLDFFGDPFPGTPGPDDLQSVIRANATLSGSTASDGDKLSPYAVAFINSLKTADVGLAEFYANVADGVVAVTPDSGQTPTVQFSGSHDFVFRPTIVSFNKEQQIFQSAMTSGNRALLQQLVNKYSGGYFYRAAKDYLDHSPLAPPAAPRLAQAAVPTAAPSIPAAAAPTPSIAAHAAVPAAPPAPARAAVAAPAAASVVGRARAAAPSTAFGGAQSSARSPVVSQVAVSRTTTDLAFVLGGKAGYEMLDDNASKAVVAAADAAKARANSAVEIVGYVSDPDVTFSLSRKGGSSAHAIDQNVLVKQAAVAQTLVESGLAGSKITVSTRVTADETLIGHVQLVHITPQ